MEPEASERWEPGYGVGNGLRLVAGPTALDDGFAFDLNSLEFERLVCGGQTVQAGERAISLAGTGQMHGSLAET